MPAAITNMTTNAPSPASGLRAFRLDEPSTAKRARKSSADKPKYLDQLLAIWEEAAAPHVMNVQAGFGSDAHQQEWHRRIQKEIGFRHRLNRLQAEEARAGVGSDDALVQDTIAALTKSATAMCIMPDRADRKRVGRPVYAGANPPNPFQWVPVMDRHTKGASVVWEMGPGVAASSGHVAALLGRRALLMQLPAPGTTVHTARYPVPPDPHGKRVRLQSFLTMIEDSGIEQAVPDLVLVPLPVPMDRYSLAAYSKMAMPTIRTSRNQHPAFAIWNPAPGLAFIDQHPEFATSLGTYISSVVARVMTLDALVRCNGTRICTSTPMVQGAPRAVEDAVRKATGWKVIDRVTAIERSGARHAWDGTPLVGESLIVWGA